MTAFIGGFLIQAVMLTPCEIDITTTKPKIQNTSRFVIQVTNEDSFQFQNSEEFLKLVIEEDKKNQDSKLPQKLLQGESKFFRLIPFMYGTHSRMRIAFTFDNKSSVKFSDLSLTFELNKKGKAGYFYLDSYAEIYKKEDGTGYYFSNGETFLDKKHRVTVEK